MLGLLTANRRRSGAERARPLRCATAEPFYVLDCNRFTAWCRCCPWRSGAHATIGEARGAFAVHARAAGPAPTAPMWLRAVIARLASARLRWCLACGRVGLWGWRPLTPSMPITWVCTNRVACQRRQAAVAARTRRGWRQLLA